MPDGSGMIISIIIVGFIVFMGALAFAAWYENNRPGSSAK